MSHLSIFNFIRAGIVSTCADALFILIRTDLICVDVLFCKRKRNVYACKRSFYARKRNVYARKRNVHMGKCNVYAFKRKVYTRKRNVYTCMRNVYMRKLSVYIRILENQFVWFFDARKHNKWISALILKSCIYTYYSLNVGIYWYFLINSKRKFIR